MCVCVYIYIYIYIISSQRPKTVGVDYSFIEYMRNLIYIYVSAQCMAIVTSLIPLQVHNKIPIQNVYSVIGWKLKPG